jgi:queuine tRNA-ribosyltransferase
VNDDPAAAPPDQEGDHEIVRTRGGALAVRSRQAGEIMHPGVGPLVEAEQLYVRQSRLAERLRAARAPLVLFDVGLGAGSNALAARAVSEAAPAEAAPLHLISFERDLGALALALEAGEAFGFVGEAAIAARALLASGRHDSARTSWRLEAGDLLAALAAWSARGDESARADVVFWDPFSPRANPGLWTVAAFSAIRRCAGPACTLYTYSASTAVRVALLLAGWAIGVGDGIGSKERTTAAAIRVGDLARPLDQRWLGRLSHAGAPMPADAPPDAIARVAAAPQFQAGAAI